MKTNLEKLLNDFKVLKLDEKKQKLKIILQGLKDLDPVFSDIIETIDNNQGLNDYFFIEVYYEIMKFGELAQRFNRQQSKLKLLKANKQIQNLRKLEKEAQKDENPEDLLKNI